MNLQLTPQEIAHIVDGKLVGNSTDTVHTLVADSRLVTAHDAFIALQGQHFDARQFIPQVLEKGVKLIIAAEENFSLPPACTATFILVKNPLLALQELAKQHRLACPLKVAAVTGSNGKSTTKQMLLAICQTCGQTVANAGNLNNQFGVPFSLLEIQPQDAFGVFELGASHPGDIEETARLAQPDVAIITNVSAAHLEFFNDLETVYNTKTEIIRCLRPGGTLVYNADDAYLSRLNTQYKGKKLSFGFTPQSDVRILEEETLTLCYNRQEYPLGIRLERHDKLNAAAATAAALALGLQPEHIQKGLTHFKPMPMRLERLNRNGVQFILDCYNANPASMKNALEILGKQPATPRLAVLGDMKELGKTSQQYHRLVAQHILDNQINEVFLAGPEMRYANEALIAIPGVKVHYALQPQEWIGELKQALNRGGSCLIKASRSMHFETILEEI